MIIVTRQTINHIPVLSVVKKSHFKRPLPTVVYFHGFTSAKEHNLPLAYLLAEKNFRVILPDSQYHGEREGDVSEIQRQLSFWDIVLSNISEMEMIKDYLENESLLLDGRLAVAGTSMGGITTAALLVAYDWICVAAILMGSAKLTVFAKQLLKKFPDKSQLPSKDEIDKLLETLKTYDLSLHIDRLKERPLFLWHGDKDRTVPFNHTTTFYHQAKEKYKDQRRIRLMRGEKQDHKVSRSAVLQTVNWFITYL